jgi:hypothetical protein
MEQQVSKEARFYSSLIRFFFILFKFCNSLKPKLTGTKLIHRFHQHWKVKRQRLGGNEGLTFDLFDGSSLSAPDITVMTRPLQMSTINIDQDTSGMLTCLEGHDVLFPSDFLGMITH